jgi:hypothetical protein
MQPAVCSAVVILLGLAACATPAGPSGPDSGVVSSGPLPYPSGSPGTFPPPNTVVPEPAVQLRRERWTQVVPVPGTNQIEVSGTMTGGPPCAVLGRIDVEEEGKQVTVTVWVGRRADAECSGPQPGLGYPYVTTVTLREPLGQRPVLDGAA